MFNELVQKRLLLPCNLYRFSFSIEFTYVLLKGTVIDKLEEVLELLDPTELKACARSVNGVNLSKMTTKQSLMEAILKHAKSSRSIQNYFSSKSLSVEQTILH